MLFSWYAATFDSYNNAYGSLGAAIGFMVWLWISAAIVLLGGELNARWSTRPLATPPEVDRGLSAQEVPGWQIT
jgi:uncharacterized BrkB/YihY/UPF0761 family membrane protein